MKTEKLHPERVKAQKAYDAAFKAWQTASNGADGLGFAVADRKLEVARADLVLAEMAHRTPSERAAQYRRHIQSSRGLD